jgi:chaperone required for assembly of F1-ATPase
MMKRFYKDAAAVFSQEGWEIHLDGKPVRTPERAILRIPAEILAQDIASEWQAQRDVIDPHTMPMMQIVTTALSLDPDRRSAMTAECLAYLNTDLIFYRVTEPEAIKTAQTKLWDPWVKWLESKSGAKLQTTFDLGALVQPSAAHDYVRTEIEKMDLWQFMALQLTTALSGSLVLALAFVQGDISAEDVFAASQIDEDYRDILYRSDLYGPDPQTEKKQDSMRRDLAALTRILRAMQKTA